LTLPRPVHIGQQLS